MSVSNDLWEQIKAADAARDAAKKEGGSKTSDEEEVSKILQSMKARAGCTECVGWAPSCSSQQQISSD